MRFVLATVALALGCSDGATLRLRAILPAPDAAGERPWLDGIGCFVVEDRRPGETEPIQTARSDDPADASLGAIAPGSHVFRVRGLDRPCDAALPNPVVAEGETRVVSVRDGQSVEAPYWFAPVESFSEIDAPDWVSEWLTGRRALSVGARTSSEGRTVVLLSGGEVLGADDFEPSRETLLFFPDDVSFELGPELACTRSHHATVPAMVKTTAGDDLVPVLAILGGDGECPEGAQASRTMEGFDPDSLEIVAVSLPANGTMSEVARPTATAFGEGGILLAGGSVIQSFSPLGGWNIEEDRVDLPLVGAAVTRKDSPDGESRYLVAGGVQQNLDLASGPVLYDENLEPCEAGLAAEDVFEGDSPFAFFLDGTVDGASPEVLVAGGRDGAGDPSSAFRIYGHETPCRLRERPVTGELSAARSGAPVVQLADGRFLVVGGDETQTAEVYAPRAKGFISLGELPTARSEGAAVLLPDGTVLVAGGAAGPIDVFNPAREVVEATGDVGWDPAAAQAIALDVLVVVSSAPAAGEGGRLQTLLANGNGGSLAGIVAAIRDLRPFDGKDVVIADLDAHVGIVTGDLGCGVGEVGDDGRLQGQGLDGQPPFLESIEVREQDLFADWVRVGEGGCASQQLGNAAIRALESDENGGFLREEVDGEEVPLFVVFATTQDDCSVAPGNEAEFWALSSDVRCAPSPLLRSQAEIVDALVALKGGKPWLVSVLPMAGALDAMRSHDFIGGLDPAPRLGELARTAFEDLGAQGLHVDLTGSYLGVEIDRRELEPLRDLLLNRLGRSACLPALASGESPRCVATWDDVPPDEATRIVRVDEVEARDDPGMRLVPASSDRCAPEPDTDHSPRFELTLTDSFQYPVGRRVRFACE